MIESVLDKTLTISFTWFIVNTAVIFNFTFSFVNKLMISVVKLPFVRVIGNLTKTLVDNCDSFIACLIIV